MPRMDGKVVAITGCTTGTGLFLANALVAKGAKVVLLNRASERADSAMSTLSAVATEHAAPEPLNIPCDLMSFKSVRDAAAALNKALDKEGLDVLVNNAGIMGFPDKATEDGLDQQMQTNHTSHFLLTKLCMPLLELAVDLRGEARIVNHSSSARINDAWEPPEDNTLKAKYLDANGGNLGGDSTDIMKGASFQRYQQSKLANVVFTYALDKKLSSKGSKIKALVAHPGVSLDTALIPKTTSYCFTPFPSTGRFKCLSEAAFGMQSGLDATIGILRMTCDPEAKSGEFFGPVGKGGDTGKHDLSEYNGKVGILKKESYADETAQEMLWSVSEKVIGEKFDI